MTNKNVKTYSYDEYLKTFYPCQPKGRETDFDSHLFGDKLAEKSLETLRKSLKSKSTLNAKAKK